MLRILATDNIHIPPPLASHALTPIAQFLDRAADLHSSDLLNAHSLRRGVCRCDAELPERRGEALSLRATCERRA